ncbi:hypothetical protein TcasGA2_TC002236 [Tribolium castaneum]|uniref:Uncharacterized protein n=1 Tax=Tribolium castaneum TaxID=7070 RepID=D7EKI7_TRICA|nr:hypothetical protein TcasGA2_TC002236 [Tribolium castaneum]
MLHVSMDGTNAGGTIYICKNYDFGHKCKWVSGMICERWEAKLQSLTTEDNSVWRMSRVLRSDRKPLPPIHSENGIVFTDEENAEAFALSMSRQCFPRTTGQSACCRLW